MLFRNISTRFLCVINVISDELPVLAAVHAVQLKSTLFKGRVRYVVLVATMKGRIKVVWGHWLKRRKEPFLYI